MPLKGCSSVTFLCVSEAPGAAKSRSDCSDTITSAQLHLRGGDRPTGCLPRGGPASRNATRCSPTVIIGTRHSSLSHVCERTTMGKDSHRT